MFSFGFGGIPNPGDPYFLMFCKCNWAPVQISAALGLGSARVSVGRQPVVERHSLGVSSSVMPGGLADQVEAGSLPPPSKSC